MNINDIVSKADKAGFESYGSFNEGDEQHDIFTCTRGKYAGEVIDVYYDYETGAVRSAVVSCQVKGHIPAFKL